MSPKKKPSKKPKISYRELLSQSEAKGQPPKPVPAPESSVAEAKKSSTQRTQRNAEENKKRKKEEKKIDEQSSPSAPDSSRVPSAASAPSASSALNAAPVPATEAQGARELPPARRRDRSRELTPRELAAVLNEEQMKAAAEKAAAAAREAAVDDAAPLTLGQLPPVAEPRSSSESPMSDTMEFAVAAAVATLPFRDRVRARAGIVEVLLFRIGSELFATDLTAAEEAIERPDVHRVPEMPEQMLGFFSLRGKLIPVFTPTLLLGASLSREHGAAVVLRAGEKRIALAIDDVDDVMPLDLARLRDVPAASDPEGVLLGVAWRENALVSLIDAEALLAACQSEQLVETA
jgi:chemotaxis signal transduction protein